MEEKKSFTIDTKGEKTDLSLSEVIVSININSRAGHFP